MGINDNPLGVSGTTISGLGDQNGALYQFLKQTSGGSSNAQRAIDLAGMIVPQQQEANPWEAAFQYFAEMGRQASQPGATALGAAVGSMQVPLDYLNAKKKEKRETDQARLQTALKLGPSLKPASGSGGGYDWVVDKDGNTVRLSNAEIMKRQAAGQTFTPWSKESTTADNTRMTVVLRGSTDDPATPVDESITSILRGDFDPEIHFPIESRPKAVTSGASSAIGKLGEDLRNNLITQDEYNAAVAKATAEPNPPQGSAPERATNRVLDFVDSFVENPNNVVDSRSLATFINDVTDMSKTETITFVENGVTKTATNPGKDAYGIIAEAYGQEIADRIKALSQKQKSSAVDLSQDKGEEPKTEIIVIAGREFTVLSSAPKNIPKEAAQGIVDARGGMRDVKIASDLIFPNGVFNKSLVIASNVMPGGGVGPAGSLTGDSRTAYQAMKRSIELLLRARSGAAVPPAEVENYMTLYYPSSFDNEAQATNKLAVLAQYFTDTNQLLSQGKLLYDPTIPESDREYDPNKHGIPVDSATVQSSSKATAAVTVTSEWTLGGVKYKQLSDGRIISEE